MAGYKEFDNKATAVAKQTVTSTLWNDFQTAVQDEVEERMEAHALNGVESGSALSISSTSVLIASGVMWCEGKRYEPSSSAIAFSASDAADTYYLYVDPTNDTSPYQKATADPGSGYLLLGQVAWDGASTLSSLVDYRRMGLVYHEINLTMWDGAGVGGVASGMSTRAIYGGCDGRSFWIQGVKGLLENNGTGGGPSLFAAYAGAGGSEAAIWSDGGDRISIAHDATDGAVASGGEPDQNRTVSAGQVVKITCDQAATGAAYFRACVYGRLV